MIVIIARLAMVGYGAQMTTKTWTLDEAQAVVLDALDELRVEGLPEEAAAERAEQVRGFTDLFALDEFVYGDRRALKKRVCSRPLCFNPPQPPRAREDELTGGKKGGNVPAYCTERDTDGYPHDNVQYSWSLRQKMRGAISKSPTAGTATGDNRPQLGGERPVSLARTSFAHQVDQLGGKLDQLVSEHRQLRASLEAATDEEARYIEIEAVRSDAQQRIETETGLRLTAERHAAAMQRAADRMAGDVEAANDAAEEAIADAGRARADREEAITRAANATTEMQKTKESSEQQLAAAKAMAEWLVAKARWDAEQEIAKARTGFEQELCRRTEEMDRRISGAEQASAQAQSAAAQCERDAETKVAAATEAVKGARSARDEAKQVADTLQVANSNLRDAAIAREREFESTLSALHETQQRELRDLRDTINTLRDHAEQATAAHNRAMDELRDKHETVLAQRVAEVRHTMGELHRAEIAQLNATNQASQIRSTSGEDD
jgi:hypothetical protein